MKYYTKWPTFPQVYINGQFAGGLDTLLEMIEEGEFDEMMPEVCKKPDPKAELAELIQSNRIAVIVGTSEKA